MENNIKRIKKPKYILETQSKALKCVFDVKINTLIEMLYINVHPLKLSLFGILQWLGLLGFVYRVYCCVVDFLVVSSEELLINK